ncbi:thiamine transporter 1-like [Artemia franciscana]|uniref:Thiamine transporter 2 n=1 Tax=Artemia franciscana TaxID=6661 RepID=A0AA88I0D7_ARTSF|nr:hypothetical protein QYM36_010373 [Artemia franciscana]
MQIKQYLPVIFILMFGFFKELRPSEPFLTEYLLGPWKNLTEEQVYQDIFPVWTYSYLLLLIAVFLLTDFLRYKPVIILEGFAYIITWILLILGQTVGAFQAVEFFYAIASSTEVAYSTYIYAQDLPMTFEKLTGLVQAALLAGRFGAGILAQVLVTTGALDYYSLNFISLGSVCVATCFSFALPSVPRSIYFYRDESASLGPEQENDEDRGYDAEVPPEATKKTVIKMTFSEGCSLIWKDFRSSYSNLSVVKWSVWWAFTMCCNLQVLNYIQPLWQTIAPTSTGSLYNGIVEALQNILSALATLAVAYSRVNWSKWGEFTLALCALISGFLLSFMASTRHLWVAYMCYILFKIIYQVLITVSNYEIAKDLNMHCYGLIFGFNTFLALILQSILTTIVASGVGLGLPPRDQFVVYGIYFFVLAGVFTTIAAYSCGYGTYRQSRSGGNSGVVT